MAQTEAAEAETSIVDGSRMLSAESEWTCGASEWCVATLHRDGQTIRSGMLVRCNPMRCVVSLSSLRHSWRREVRNERTERVLVQCFPQCCRPGAIRYRVESTRAFAIFDLERCPRPMPHGMMPWCSCREIVMKPISSLFYVMSRGALAATMGLAMNAVAAEPRFDSVYTDLAQACKSAFEDSEIEEGQDMPLRCRGPGDASIYIYFSAEAAYAQIETAAGASQLEQAVLIGDYDRGKVEWRMADGVPFAIIVRIRKNNERPETLEVRGIGPHGALSGSIKVAGRADANAAARALADEGFPASP